MTAQILSTDIFGNLIEVQCKVTKGLPAIQIVGLGNKAVDESKERVRAAFHSLKLPFPKGRILINLSPADLPKDGTSYDLAIAYALLVAAGTLSPPKNSLVLYGELSLDGTVLPVRGMIGRLNSTRLGAQMIAIIPAGNTRQASLVTKIKSIPIRSLQELIDISTGAVKPSYITKIASNTAPTSKRASSFDEVRGQELAKRALQISAAGNHNILLHGPPGTGKSMLAKALTDILPALSEEEILVTTHIHSLRSHDHDVLIEQPPLRSPHHSASNIAILGGGQKALPGEISLAHNGVLFLDELLEFNRSCIEALRQPLEDRFVTISRAESTVKYPSSFLLIATMNPCPCGNLGSKKECTCSAFMIQSYQKKLSGPILDRIDLFVRVDDVNISELLDEPTTNSSEKIRKSVLEARNIQQKRNKSLLNSALSNKQIRELSITDEARNLLERAAESMNLSPRAYFRILRVSQTISDLDQKSEIDLASVAEALQFRKNILDVS